MLRRLYNYLGVTAANNYEPWLGEQVIWAAVILFFSSFGE